MADKPSRALVVYGDGFVPLVSPSHSHLHSLAALSSCGFLALRFSENDNGRDVREFAQLVDAYDYYISLKGEDGETSASQELEKRPSIQTMSERFMGLKAALVTASPSIGSFARGLGFTVFEIDDLIKQKNKSIDPSQLLTLLGFSEGKYLEKTDYDLVLFHVKAGEEVQVLKDKMVIKTDTNWLNRFAGEIMQIAQPGSEIASRLNFSLILSYGTVDEKDHLSSSISAATLKMNSDLSLLRPRQSYTLKGGNVLNDIRNHHPFLIAQWQEAVTRKDMAKEFSYKEFKEQGGNAAILADRILHEVAFKLWKAPKYGA